MLRIGQVEATATQDGKYTDGSVAGGIAATRLRAAAFNAMQEELAHIVESAGLALDINDMTQVLKAIQKLTLSRANPFADIKSDGAAAISTALTNLGLGEIATVADIQAGTPRKLIDAKLLKQYLPAKALNPDGYVRIPDVPGGVIIQWGQVGTPVYEGEQIVTLPTPFPNTVRFAIAIPLNLSGNGECDIFAQLKKTSQATLTFYFSWTTVRNPADGFQWIALGY